MDSETLEIVRAFVAESLDSLNEQEEKIQVLASGNAKENINSIFRVFHTIKGLSGFLGFNVISTVAQEVEVLLDVLRKKPSALSATSITLINESFSLLKTLLTTVGAEVKDSGHGEAVRNHIGKLKETVAVIASSAEVLTSPVKVSLPTSSENASLTVPLPVAVPVSHSASSRTTAASTVSSKKVPDIPKPQTLGAEVRENVIIDKPQATVSLSSKQIGDVQGDTPKVVTPDISLQRFISESLDHISVIEQGCRRLEQNPHDMTIIGAVFGSVLHLKASSRSMGFVEIETKSIDVEAILDAVRRNTLTVYPGLIAMVLNMLASITTLIQSLAARQALKIQKESARRASELPAPSVATSGAFAPIPLPKAYSVKAPQTAKDEAQSDIPVVKRREAIVDADMLEKLYELVGELVAIETMVTKNPDIVGLELTRFNKAAAMLHNVTTELENTTQALQQRTS